jgi:diacylglycerol kinase (ATP)
LFRSVCLSICLILGVIFPLSGDSAPLPKKKVCFIVNPISGGKKEKKIKSLVKKHLDLSKFDYKIFKTQRPKHATVLAAKAEEKGFDLVVAVGGDGTVNEVAQGLIGSPLPLGIIPMGSGNGISGHFNIPADPKEALHIINSMHTQWIDTIRINQESYIGVAGIGFDAEVSQAFSELRSRGFAAYIKVVLSELPNYQAKEYELVIDGKLITEKAFLICFANSQQYGNHAFIAPHAKIDDGFLDVIIMKEFPKHAAPKLVHDLFNRQIETSKYTTVLRCQEVIIHKPLHFFHLDGEPMQFDEDVYIRVLPSSLKILTPAL